MPTRVSDEDMRTLLRDRSRERPPRLSSIGMDDKGRVPMTGTVCIRAVFTIMSPRKGLCHLLIGTDDKRETFSVQTSDMESNRERVMYFDRQTLAVPQNQFRKYAKDRVGMDPEDLIAEIQAAYLQLDPPIAPHTTKKK